MKTEIVGLTAWMVLAVPFVLLFLAMLLFARRNAGGGAADVVVGEAAGTTSSADAPHLAPLPPVANRASPGLASPTADVTRTTAPPLKAGPAPVTPIPAPTPKPDSRSSGRWPAMTAPRAGTPVPARDAPSPPIAGSRVQPAAPAAPSAEAPSPEAVVEPPPPAPPPRIDFAPLIAAAEAGDDVDRLPTLYVALARQQREDGLPDRQVGDLLRKAIRMAAMHGQKLAHAVARIELGDLEAAAGDMTSACEHWQIARSLFHDLRQARDIGSTDARMRKHGCPTDWVLNDF